jgi:hypothetical protein
MVCEKSRIYKMHLRVLTIERLIKNYIYNENEGRAARPYKISLTKA